MFLKLNTHETFFSTVIMGALLSSPISFCVFSIVFLVHRMCCNFFTVCNISLNFLHLY